MVFVFALLCSLILATSLWIENAYSILYKWCFLFLPIATYLRSKQNS